MNFILRDLRYGLRMLRKAPGATLVAILSLALGVGATTAIFTVINAVLLRPLPYPAPEQLVVLRDQNLSKNIRDFLVSPATFHDWAERNNSFSSLCALKPSGATLVGSGQPERLEIVEATAAVFDTLGVKPTIGRLFLPEDADPARGRVAVLSYGLWQRRFAASTAVLDHTVTLDGVTYQIVGVVPEGVKLFNMPAEVWVPYILDNKELAPRGHHIASILGRLKPGVTIEQASAEMNAIAARLASEHPDFSLGWSVALYPLREYMIGGFRQPLWILMGAVGLVLLIACSNVASILLMKAGSRHRELAIRTALGASPWRVLGQMLAESVVLSLGASVLGVALAWAGTKALARITPPGMAELGDLTFDSRVLLFALSVALATGLVFGLVPGLSSMRADVNSVLRSSGRSGMAGAGWGRIRGSLVIAEVTLAQVLLIGAGLLMQSLFQLQNVQLGFRPDHVVSARIYLPEARYKDIAVSRFYSRFLDRLKAIPGVQAAGVTRDLPLSGANPSLNYEIQGRPVLPTADQPRARFRAVSPGYFNAIGINLVEGRFFEETDGEKTQPVAVINEAFAKREWPGSSPLGQHLRSGFDNSPWCTIVGVVNDVRHAGPDSATEAEIYYHYQQIVPAMMNFVENTMTVAVRTPGDPAQLTSAIRVELAQLDNELALNGVKTADQLVDGSVAQPRFRTVLLGLFAASALLLAAIGLYGLLASGVLQRMNELGIRAALGASTAELLRMVVAEGLLLAGVGVVIGLALAFALVRVLEHLLFGVTTRDWIAFTFTPVVLLLVALLASLVPAIRAARVDPAQALREQ